MQTKQLEQHQAAKASRARYDKSHPQPDPTAPLNRSSDPIAKYHQMVHDVTSWPLESEKEVNGALRYFEKTWVPAAEQHLSHGHFSDALYMSSALLSQFPDFVERAERQILLSSLARDRRVRRIVRGMMKIGREALRNADSPFLDKVAHSFMREVRNQPFYEEYRAWTLIEDNKF